MGIQTRTTGTGEKRYKARVKVHGREVASRTFTRKRDAQIWHDEQVRKLRMGDWIDPNRGKATVATVAADWLDARRSVKRRTHETDASNWRLHVEPAFGNLPVASVTPADVSAWLGRLATSGCAPASMNRYLATLRSVLNHAVADGRVTANAAASIKPPSGAHTRREGVFLTIEQLHDLADAATGPYAETVLVLGLAGLRWGELAGLQVQDRVSVPGRGLRLQRSVLMSRQTGELFEDTLKNKRARTVPLVPELVPIVDRWADGKQPGDWLFGAPKGGPMSEANWQRSIRWSAATKAIGVPRLRPHDLRHTCASVWLGAGADPKVVQRILGHASAAMTMDLYGHLIDRNLWQAAEIVGGLSGASKAERVVKNETQTE